MADYLPTTEDRPENVEHISKGGSPAGEGWLQVLVVRGPDRHHEHTDSGEEASESVGEGVRLVVSVSSHRSSEHLCIVVRILGQRRGENLGD